MGSAALKRKGLKRNKNAGFTLVELIAVVALISMIAIYITIEINQSSDDAKVGIATAFLVSNVPNAISSYRARHLGTCVGIGSESLLDNESPLPELTEDTGANNLKKRLVQRGLSLNTPWGAFWTATWDENTLTVTIEYPVPGAGSADSAGTAADIIANIESQGKVVSIEQEGDGIKVVYSCA